MQLRNIAIIAHVDHGKTTLVDRLLSQSGTYRENQQVQERAMDRNELERERGITIQAKCTSVLWKADQKEAVRVNIVDTPGHSDFGAEVERILSMVDGVVLLVDSAEGPMPQTKFVTMKALKLGLPAIVVINKADRQDARIEEVHGEIFDLFADLGASEEQLDFPLLIASAKQGWARRTDETQTNDMTALFEVIVESMPQPRVAEFGKPDTPFAMRASLIERDPYLGRILTGRIERGILKINQAIKALDVDGNLIEQGRVAKILAFRGLMTEPVVSAVAGDIIAIAGLSKATVSNTLCDLEVQQPLPGDAIDPPTLAITISINDSPLAGREGDKVQSRVIRERLLREAEGNVAIRVKETSEKDAFEVAGRGELQLGILIETMRREGFELSVSRPRVIYTEDESGQRLEPFEDVMVDVDDEYCGIVIENISMRRGELKDMEPGEGGKTRMTFLCPSRGLIGYHGQFLTDTRGAGVMSRLFHGYLPYAGTFEGRNKGVLISNAHGEAVAFALWNLEERGEMIITPGEKVYEGMIIGINSKPQDLVVNPLKAKKLSNVRSVTKDEAVRLTKVRPMGLEEAITFLEDDELLEVTPKSIRIRKKFLLAHERKRAERAEEVL